MFLRGLTLEVRATWRLHGERRAQSEGEVGRYDIMHWVSLILQTTRRLFAYTRNDATNKTTRVPAVARYARKM